MPIVFIVLLLLVVALQRAIGFPARIDESVLWVILLLSLIPLGLLLFDILAPRARTIELLGFKLALSGEFDTLQASISVPTNIGVPGQALNDSNTVEILASLDDMANTDVAVIDLQSGQAWWETRLLIVAAGAARRRRPLAVVFLATEDGVQRLFQGWAEPEALLQTLFAFNSEYRRCYERARAAGAELSLMVSDSEQTGTTPPAWMSGAAAQYRHFVPLPNSSDFLVERILGNELGNVFENKPGGPTKITSARLKRVFGPVLQIAHIEEGSPDQQKVEEFLRAHGRYVAITDKGIYRRMMLRESGMAALVLSLTPQRGGSKANVSSKDTGLKSERSTEGSSSDRGPLTLTQGLIGLSLLILFSLGTSFLSSSVKERAPLPDATTDHTALMAEASRNSPLMGSHDADRLDRAGSAQPAPPASAAPAAVPPVAVSVICSDGARQQPVPAKATAQTEPCAVARVGGTVNSVAAASPPAPRLLARWVQLVPPSVECGSITARTQTGPAALPCAPGLVVRAVLGGGGSVCDDIAFRIGTHIALTMRLRPNPDPSSFPVTLCEAEVEPGDKAVSFADGSRIAWDGLERLSRVAVLGDSGCDTTLRQDCGSALSWPFREVALAATGIPDGSAGPDLVIHVGDYRYRQRGAGDGDNWDNWYEDFFKPAEPLLVAAPWVMVRGNHENCYGEHGAGWFFLLQPEFGSVSRCAKDANRDPDNLPPYALDLQAGARDRPLRLVVVDSANAKYRCHSWARDFAIRDEKRLAQLLTGSGGKIWLLTHYPVWDAAENYLLDKPGHDNVGRCNSDFETQPTVYRYREVMSAVLKEADWRPEAIISGDTHQFQVLRIHDAAPNATELTARSSYPLQIVAGHAGTKLDPALGPRAPDKSLLRSCEEVDERVAYFQRKLADSEARHWILGKAVCSYGYATVNRTGDRWTLSLKSFGTPAGPSSTSCELGSEDASCYRILDKARCSRLGEDSDCLPLRAAPN
jgi:hypothetical protein